ncbi:YdaU family protein [Shinella zoogloeoides]|uniref:YdaU family protein n=1 Tax=Shinella zoogloeoides TaxID=352475 RepID=UPI001FE03B7A|nr:DUF1376 domain-containing protein [Shinella zoogloeoides]
MSNRAWMPLHIADYLADTGHLTATEHGAYLLMIMHYWQNGSLPANERVIARIAKLTVEQWEDSRDILVMLFGPGWTHKRIDAELSKADEIIEKRRSAAEARHGKGKKQTQDANAMHVQSNCSDTGVPPLTDNLSAPASDEAAAACAGPDLDPQVLESKLRDAAGDKMQPHGGFVVGPVMELIRQGADIDLDVLPTVRSVAARLGRPARSWDYFVPAIQEAFDKRKAAGSWEHRSGAPPPVKPASPAMQRHERIRQNLKREIYGDENADNAGPVIDLAERDYRPH